ncbi:MAG: phenylalanine--tRNA ligase subunit beta [Flavobacteriales bacterium]|nr:phenylalanine--tRNA ligase subunit beta [Flavobacteriales bacterium]
MKISYNWLKQYIDIQLLPEQVAKILTNTGLEVESIEKIQSVKGGLEGLIIGKVLTKIQHPNADKLSITTVDVGSKIPLQIVCGASNVAEGQKVVVATVGTTLYKGEDSFQIKSAKLRGELSEGMICAEDEIGLGNSHDGIMVLNNNAEVGNLAKNYFGIQDDYIFEVGLTPNRTDAISHIGVARDLAAALSLDKKVEIKYPDVSKFKSNTTNFSIKVEVEDTQRCPRYSGVTLCNVLANESPKWLKERLSSIGVKPINTIVDVTNYVLHETGQPLHAFDADKIVGNTIKVKTVSENTKFTTLEGKQRELSSNDLMICNSQNPMCIAGVYGGMESGVSGSTTNIFLESAYFNPISIRKTAKFHALNTDASYRYERGADPSITVFALKRAILLLQEIFQNTVSSEIIDIYPNPIKDFDVSLNYQNCDRLIGKKIDRNSIKNILKSLEIKIKNETSEGLELLIPTFKTDVQREVDVIEEILRIYGYNNIEIPNVMTSAIVSSPIINAEKIIFSIKNHLASIGFYEILSNSLSNLTHYKNSDNLVVIKNPLSTELNVMRNTLLFEGLKSIEFNQNRKISDLKLFEVGKTYFKFNNTFKENLCLGIFLSGSFESENWNSKNIPSTLFHLKGVIHSLFEKFGISLRSIETVQETNDNFEYSLSYKSNGEELAIFGCVNNSIQNQFKVTNEIFYAQLNLESFINCIKKSKTQHHEISKFPHVIRDLALLIEKSITYQQIEQKAFSIEKRILKQIRLFDVYEGKNIEPGKKSYAVSFTFQDEEKTLTDGQVDNVMSKLIQSFSDEFKATIR